MRRLNLITACAAHEQTHHTHTTHAAGANTPQTHNKHGIVRRAGAGVKDKNSKINRDRTFFAVSLGNGSCLPRKNRVLRIFFLAQEVRARALSLSLSLPLPLSRTRARALALSRQTRTSSSSALRTFSLASASSIMRSRCLSTLSTRILSAPFLPCHKKKNSNISALVYLVYKATVY